MEPISVSKYLLRSGHSDETLGARKYNYSLMFININEDTHTAKANSTALYSVHGK